MAIHNFKHKMSFSSTVRALVSEEHDKYLSKASLESLREFLPKGVDISKKEDFLPFATDAFVANRINRNLDGVLTKEAILVADLFPFSFVDIEHSRDKIVGVISNAYFSEFGTGKPLSREEVLNYKKPFNVVLAGVIWKMLSPKLCELIEESNDPASPSYQKISASWELGFRSYIIGELPKTTKNLEDAKLVTDENQLEQLEGKLKCYGGTGETEDGNLLIRIPVQDVIPLGLGLTESPAADVQGVAVPEEAAKPKVKASETEATQPNTKNIISQPVEINVKKDSRTMKLTNIKELTDESLKTITASEITDFIANELKQANEQFVKEKNSVQEALDKAQKEYVTLVAENTVNKTKLEELQKKISEIEAQTKAKELQEKFNIRMSALTEKYELDDEMNKIIAGEIKEMSDDIFEKYEKNLAVLLKGKEKKPQQANASAQPATPPTPTQVVEDAIKGGQPQTPTVPTTPTTPTPSKEDVYRAAFGEEGWIIEFNK